MTRVKKKFFFSIYGFGVEVKEMKKTTTEFSRWPVE